MIELISLIILVGSIIGIGIIIYQKIPLLLELPETVPFHFGWRTLLPKIKNFFPFKEFSAEIFLQKVLSKVRILTLKTDSKTSSWLQKLRARSQKKKFEEDDNYWRDIKKSTKNK